jgi:hypothetical protein
MFAEQIRGELELFREVGDLSVKRRWRLFMDRRSDVDSGSRKCHAFNNTIHVQNDPIFFEILRAELKSSYHFNPVAINDGMLRQIPPLIRVIEAIAVYEARSIIQCPGQDSSYHIQEEGGPSQESCRYS